jgi:hypothetical protein
VGKSHVNKNPRFFSHHVGIVTAKQLDRNFQQSFSGVVVGNILRQPSGNNHVQRNETNNE